MLLSMFNTKKVTLKSFLLIFSMRNNFYGADKKAIVFEPRKLEGLPIIIFSNLLQHHLFFHMALYQLYLYFSS